MAVTITRGERKAYIYRPVGSGFRLAAALQAKGWEIPMCQQWNDKDDLLFVRIPKTKTDADLAADIETAFPDEDFQVETEDHYWRASQ